MKIIPDSQGGIEIILLWIPSATLSDGTLAIPGRFERHFKSLILSLGLQVTYIVVCDPTLQDIIAEWFSLLAAGAKVTFIPDSSLDNKFWVQDSCIARTSKSGKVSISLSSNLYSNSADLALYQRISTALGGGVVEAPLHIMGGNVLGGTERTLIGADVVMLAQLRRHKFSKNSIICMLQEYFGTAIHILGGHRSSADAWQQFGICHGMGNQPLFHLDMYITRTGVYNAEGKEIVFLGRPSKASEVLGAWSDNSELSAYDFNHLFDETEEQLCEFFEVRYLPLMATRGSLGGLRSQARTYFLSFNNCLRHFQLDSQRETVVLPKFSQDSFLYDTDAGVRRALEDSVRDEWTAIGVEPYFIDGLEDLAFEHGGLHCLTKVLKRLRPHGAF